MPTPTDWAYLAAMLDGEGTLVAYKGVVYERRYPVILFAIYNTHLGLLEHVRSLFGGVIYTNRPGSATRKHMRLLRPQTKNVPELLRGMMPYLIVKRRQAEIVLEVAGLMIPPKAGRKNGTPMYVDARRASLVSELKTLNRRGGNAS